MNVPTILPCPFPIRKAGVEKNGVWGGGAGVEKNGGGADTGAEE